jgi:NADPH2 dehydrogenase
MTEYQLLLAPIKIGDLTLANRIVMPPMVIFQAGDDGLVTQKHVEHYQRRSGPGLVIVEGTAVLPDGRISHRQLGIYGDHHIEGLSRLSRAIHENGGLAGIQIHHAGAVAFKDDRDNQTKKYIGILIRLAKQQLMFSGLLKIRKAFKAASLRAVEAGFDVIEIHAAHGYLFTQFLSPLRNWRLDRYGGRIENRRRLLFEVFQDIRSEVKGRALATCRLGIADGCRGGFALKDGLDMASLLEKNGVEFLDISSGSGTPASVRPNGSPYSGRLHLAQVAKQVLSIPVIGGGGLRHPDLAEKALQDKMADMIFIGKAMLADPDWARKAIEGRPESIVSCYDCRPCFYFSDSSKCPAQKRLNRSF